MRTTLDIDDEVLKAAQERAHREGKTVGAVLSELARVALTTPPTAHVVGEPPAIHGIRPFPRRGGAIVTNQLVNKLRGRDAY